MGESIPISGVGVKADSDITPSESPIDEVEIESAQSSEPSVAHEPDNQDDGGEVQARAVLAVQVTKKQRTPTKRELAAREKYTTSYDTPTRKPSSTRPASFNPLAWVADGVTGAIEEARHNDLGMSEDFWKHLYAVRRESLLTARALVESLLAKVESKSEQLEDRKQRRERRGSVDIDF